MECPQGFRARPLSSRGGIENCADAARCLNKPPCYRPKFTREEDFHPQMTNDCETCNVLWRDYAAATHAHIRVESKLDLARLRHDHEAIQRLLPEAQAAAGQRSALRSRIGEHERLCHSVPSACAGPDCHAAEAG